MISSLAGTDRVTACTSSLSEPLKADAALSLLQLRTLVLSLILLLMLLCSVMSRAAIRAVS
jgi:hypothetical protein